MGWAGDTGDQVGTGEEDGGQAGGVPGLGWAAVCECALMLDFLLRTTGCDRRVLSTEETWLRSCL